MRFIHLYLAGYFLLILAAVVALWRGGVLARLSPLSVLVTLAIVVGLGVLLALTAARPAPINND